MKLFPMPEGLDFAFKASKPLAATPAIRAGLGIGICQIGIAARDPDLVHLLPEVSKYRSAHGS